MTSLHASALEVTPSTLRSQFARWPTGVTIITAQGNGRPIGKTVNSFHATSLEPPLVGWCIDHKSSQFAEWIAATGYVVHVMGHEHMEMVSRFAKAATDRFAELPHERGLDGMPILQLDVPLRLECRVVDRFAAGDHTYLIGEVIVMTAAEIDPATLTR